MRRKRRFVSSNDALAGFLKRALPDSFYQGLIESRFRSVLGDPLASKVEVREFKEGRLSLWAEDPIWATQLKQDPGELERSMKRAFPFVSTVNIDGTGEKRGKFCKKK